MVSRALRHILILPRRAGVNKGKLAHASPSGMRRAFLLFVAGFASARILFSFQYAKEFEGPVKMFNCRDGRTRDGST